jgi:hypothetical protein
MARPELIKDSVNASIIPSTIPPVIRARQHTVKPETTAIPARLSDTTNTTGWWMSERLEGVRLVWNGLRKTVHFLNGKQAQIPQQYTDKLPDLILEAVLVYAMIPYTFLTIVSSHSIPVQTILDYLYTNNLKASAWDGVQLYVLDIPSQNPLPFEERMNLRDSLVAEQGQVKRSKWVRCEGPAHLKSFLKKIGSNSGVVSLTTLH